MRDILVARKDGQTELLTIYDAAEAAGVLQHIPAVTVRGKRRLINVPVAFDIETSRIGEMAGMYIWQMSFNGTVIMGRTWDEWINVLQYIHDINHVDAHTEMYIFVHNLAYEWSFFHYLIPVAEVFARESGHPISVKLGGTLTGIIFRCTLSISGDSLAAVARRTLDCPYEKTKSDIDYTLQRHAGTPMTDTELSYCALDVLILHYYILSLMVDEYRHYICYIPMTKTGFVRRECRKRLQNDEAWNTFYKNTQLDADCYMLYHDAFRGGDTHAELINVDTPLICHSADLTSSYPSRFLEDFPTSRPIWIPAPDADILHRIDAAGYMYVADVTIINVRRKTDGRSYLPIAKCLGLSHVCTNDNGRVYDADCVRIAQTSLDWQLTQQYYDYDIYTVNRLLYHYKHGKLPPEMINLMLDYYAAKTTLKGVRGAERGYMQSKERLNSLYGMCVTNPLRDCVTFDFSAREWQNKVLPLTLEYKNRIQEELNEYYRCRNHFLPYHLGVWITALSRWDLHKLLQRCGTDAVYWDTDSDKFCGDHIQDIESLNAKKIAALMGCGYAWDRVAPARDDKRYPLGLWDIEYNGDAFAFRTIGAKKYFVRHGDEYSITVAGLSKSAVSYLCKTYGDIVAGFPHDAIIPESDSGRTAIVYSEQPASVTFQDYRGITGTLSEQSYAVIKQVTYQFGLTDEYDELLKCRRVTR